MEIKNNSFSRNVVILTFGPVISSIVSVLAEPFIARYYLPAVYGNGMLFSNIIMVLSPIVFLRYNYAIPQAKDDIESSSLLLFCILFFNLFVLSLSSIFYFYPFISILLFGINIANYILFFLISLYFMSLSYLFRYWFTYRKRFIILTVNTIVLQISNTVLLIIFGYLGYVDVQSFIFVRMTSFVFAATVIVWFFFKSDFHIFIAFASFKQMITSIIKFRDIPIFEYWGFIISLLVMQIPLFLIAKYWDSLTLGLYAKAFVIISLLTSTLSDSINRVYHKEIADKINANSEIEIFTSRLLMFLVKLSLLFIFSLIFLGEDLFSFVLGINWSESGRFAGLIAPWMFFSMISYSIRPIYNLTSNQKRYSMMMIGYISLVTLIFYVGYQFKLDIASTLILFSTVASLFFITEILTLLRLINVKIMKLVSETFRYISLFIPWIVLNFILNMFLVNKSYLILLHILIALLYFAVILINDPITKKMINNINLKNHK